MSLSLSPTNIKLPKCPPALSPPAAFGSSVASTLRPVSKVAKKFMCLAQYQANVTSTLPMEKVEIFTDLDSWAESNILVFLNPIEKCWQPQDFLPDSSSDGFHDQIQELRERAKEIPDDYFVVLVGNMITEEAVPTYLSMLNDGVRNVAGTTPTSWSAWNRGWTAEENRHGDLLHEYLYLCGRVNMRQVERTVQHLIGAGMDIRTGRSPYLSLIYTSFQERATFVSHGNTARLARAHGDVNLAKICGTIAADEKRHETAYTKMVEKLFEVDPDETMMAFGEMMKKKILMPAHYMYDGHDDQLFDHFSAVAQRIGVYTANDYADIVEHLVRAWRVEGMTGLSSEAQKAQDYVCGLAPKIRRLDERARVRAKQGPMLQFSWIYDREVQL